MHTFGELLARIVLGGGAVLLLALLVWRVVRTWINRIRESKRRLDR